VFRTVAVGDRFACALDMAGAVHCWGSDLIRDQALSPPLGSYGSLVVGKSFGCAVDHQGDVHCWGRNECRFARGETMLASGIAAYGGTFCEVLEGSSVSCTGDQRLEVPEASEVAVGAEHVCVLNDAGVVTCFGSDEYGQLDAPDGEYVSIAAGEAHTCALAAAGRVTCWGAGTTPAIGECEARPNCGQSAPPDDAFVQISSGAVHVCGVTKEGRIMCWGDDAYGKATPPELGR
jgi:alpha-tubulin suppressor-like RCC1 family protein